MQVSALIFAGGSGKRMTLTSKPKQFLEYKNKPIIIYTLELFEQNDNVDNIVVVCIKDWIDYLKELLVKFNITKVVKIVPGGETGQGSIFNGLKEVYTLSPNPKEDIVLIHDGVRPLINQDIINDNIFTTKDFGDAITVSPAIETIINTNDDNVVTNIIDRSKCMLARAPQTFRVNDIYSSHLKANKENRQDFIDSATMMRYYGYDLKTVMGPAENIKITTPSDFYVFKAWVEDCEGEEDE
ncbi:MAG: IspD/TarI family cytidylyltransferase [Thomasclavelia sp.]|jgi:2-C-methyl-D-erythritol 4-phosphate cytidylyltransferase|nr:IspD/TarI family cytidylyltransferase [Thomasclavelia sp.]